MYEFVSGPLAWIAFLVFVAGTGFKFYEAYQMVKKEKVLVPYMDLKFGLRSVVRWLIPFATTNWRQRPAMTVATFAFHICLVFTPLFLIAHLILIEGAVGFSWFYISECTADVMSVIVLLSSFYFLYRRLSLPEVRYVTTIGDYLFLVVVILTFTTGLAAHYQWLSYRPVMVFHMLSGEAMLVAIPFTRLSHMFYFFFTRAYMGSEFGAVRNVKDW